MPLRKKKATGARAVLNTAVILTDDEPDLTGEVSTAYKTSRIKTVH